MTLAVHLADAPDANGDTLLQVTEWPVPVAGRPLDASRVEVEFDRPVQPGDSPLLTVGLEQVRSTGFVQIVCGVLIE